jgi:hypothetical protein
MSLPRRLSALGVPRAALPELAAAAVTVTRLLKNNPVRFRTGRTGDLPCGVVRQREADRANTAGSLCRW